jgi:hypothetical protein
MTKGQIIGVFRYYAARVTGQIPDTDASALSADTLFQMALDRYADETEYLLLTKSKADVETANIAYSYVHADCKRMLRVSFVSWDGKEISIKSRKWMDDKMPGWRTADEGTPTWAVRSGTRAFQLVPAPAAAGTIYIEGPVTVSATEVITAGAAYEPDIPAPDHELLAIWMAIRATIDGVNTEDGIRASILYPLWQAGIKAAVDRNVAPSENIKPGETSGLTMIQDSVDTSALRKGY